MNNMQIDNTSYYLLPCGLQLEDFIARRRLCGMAAPETRRVWGLVVDALSKIDPVLAQFCTPMCVYRGGCPEAHGCGWHGPNGGRT